MEFGVTLVFHTERMEWTEWSWLYHQNSTHWLNICRHVHTHTQWHNPSYGCFLCCPGNAASSCLVDTCWSVMRTRLPGECGSGGGCELNLPAPLAHFLSLCDQRGGSGFYRTSVCQCVEILCSKVCVWSVGLKPFRWCVWVRDGGAASCAVSLMVLLIDRRGASRRAEPVT